jgi:hypothetical protein
LQLVVTNSQMDERMSDLDSWVGALSGNWDWLPFVGDTLKMIV